MKAPPANGVGPKKADFLADVVTQVLAIGATRFEVNQDYGQGEVWAVKGPLELSVASFRSNSAKAAALTGKLNDLKKNQTNVVVNGSEYLLAVEVLASTGGDAFRVTINATNK